MPLVNIAALRKRLGCSQARLAALLDVHPGTVLRWEAGQAQGLTLRCSRWQAYRLTALDLVEQVDHAAAAELVQDAAHWPGVLEFAARLKLRQVSEHETKEQTHK